MDEKISADSCISADEKISADSRLFVDEMASYEEKKRLCSVHVFRVFVSVCDIFDIKSVCKES